MQDSSGSQHGWGGPPGRLARPGSLLRPTRAWRLRFEVLVRCLTGGGGSAGPSGAARLVTAPTRRAIVA